MASSSPGDLSMSFTQDSDEYREMHCEQCDMYNEKSTADGFCIECMEYMCNVCLKYHSRLSPGHRQQDKSTMPQDFCFEKCSRHTSKLIKYYCFTCKTFACYECKLRDHEQCNEIGHVPTVAKGVENSGELKDLFKDIKTFNTELERLNGRLEAKINQSSTQEKRVMTATNKQREDTLKHVQEQKQLVTDTYDREIEITIEKLQAEKQEKINQISVSQKQLDDKLTTILNTIEKRQSTEKATLQRLKTKTEKVSGEAKDLALDIEQKQRSEERCNFFITMKASEKTLENLQQEYMGLQKVTNEERTDDLTHELVAALNEFKALKKIYTLDFGTTREEARRFGTLTSNLFVYEWNRHVSARANGTEHSALMHVLTWPPFPHFLTYYYPNRMNMLTEECVENLVKAVSMIENVVTKLSEGSLAVDIFRHISKPDSKFPELAELAQTKEIHTAASIRKEIEKRQQEIKTCTTRVVNTIMRMVKTFDLKGDFTRIKVIADDSDLAVDSFDDSVITDHLENMTPAKERCLAAFVNCKPLIQWLRMSRVASDVKRLQASVDLAFLSAGDEPINIARAQCFHSAVTGYAPLIRDLDESCGYKELLQLCSLVWKELETDPKLPAKLMDLNRLLQWLKATMEPDVTQMMHVEAICARGIFTIGKNAWKDDTSSQNIGETSMHVLADILKLSVPEQTDNRELKNWTFSEIQSLQRNLGKLEKYTENAVRFRMIVDGFTRMGIIYTKLCTAGCFLFKNWTARFHCDPDLNKGVCVVLQFGFENVDQQLQGRMTKTGDILDMILDIAKFMEVCFAEWLLYIKEARRRCSELNHFTNDQLFILQKELGKVGTDSEPSELVYPMLSFLKDNCSPGDLLEAMADAQKTLNIPLTNRAIEEVDPEDTRAGSVWSMDHEKEVMDNYKPLTQSDEQIKKQPQQVDIHTLITTLITKLRKESSVGSGPLIQNLNALWRDFLQALSFSFRDCLSLKHIAIILSILEKKNTTYINRSLHTVFKEDQPNLVICEDESVFITALTVYMADKDQPLPQPDEVLTCTKETKTDEIDMFLRRVFYSGSKKIYCLVNADMLTYDVDEYTERCVEEYLKETHAGSSYRLIVISGCNKQSGFLASLNKFKRQPLQISTEAVREYLLTKLSVQENSSTRLSPAAVADRERSTVRVIKSWQAGAGKSLCVERMKEKFPRVDSVYIALNGISICPEEVIKSLLPFTLRPNEPEPRIFHIDIYHEVENGVDNFLFNLLILGCLRDKTGLIWRRSLTDIFLIENTPLLISVNSGQDANWRYVHSLLSVLPNRTCRSPKECLCIYKGILPQDYDDSDQLFDDEMYRSDVFQRPYRYLMRTDKTKVQFKSDIESCLQTILRHCGLEEPSWRDVHYFVMFLNRQLIAFENNPFVGEFSFKQGTDFSVFVLEFLLKMSRDFATRSLRFTDESNQSLKSKTNVETEEMLDGLLDEIQLKHKWEDSRHPCLLFNSDNTTFTFLGFHVEPNSGHLIDPLTRQVLELRIMNSSLHSSLVRNGVSLSDDFDSLSRHDKIMRLCIFMGIQYPHDPDENFILTTDIVKKIMAIHMRFRYDLPTLIMGETGYGKTRLVKFLCDIQLPSEYRKNTTNMIRVKVHGSPSKDIIKAVRQAEQVAEKNRQEYGDSVHTVLFFDGVNVTKDIGLIKEIMCEGSLLGKKLNKNLKIISACNPYRRHSDKMMKEMEQEGFGGHMDTNDANVLPGHLPLQCLVYKVYPLPHSLLPLVWDFGRLEADVENVFINQIVKKYIRDAKLPDIPGLAEVVSAILAASQDYMKKHMDEYCVVSLRNVERALTVMSWFYQNSRGGRTIFCLMDEILRDGSFHFYIYWYFTEADAMGREKG
ncbi:E3 ubiquitin-protein ligase rnf213-alpha-like [Mercenaria mercenaria]|uniref:E3 ubiquitin-protein ligase rnf213-alpha-like n=1 Tax=Mercenaria mercenaria TaxID=6596 RepID=UPI00234ECC8F|nr:E3 ubiquitin-protein ligase rnf213-alpha-like [Mercenaria mercenaria]